MSAVLDRVRGHLAANETGGFFTRDEMAAVVARLDEALAEVERLVRQHATEMFAAGSAAGEVLRHRSEAIDALTAERDRLTRQVQRVRDLFVDGDGYPLDPESELPIGDFVRALDGEASP